MKVSIITIAYNNLAGLKDTYKSIKQQTFRGFEWIVVDGGSTDGTKEFLQKHDSEIAWWCCEPDKGVYNAQNKGTEKAQGEYCIYMNSGDSFYANDVLEKIFEKDINADIIYGNWMLVFEDGKKWLGFAPRVADFAYFFYDNMCHQAMLIKTEAVKNRPYDESFRIYADWEEWLALYMQGKKFERIDMTICNFMVGGISTGDNASEVLKAERKAEIKRINARYYTGRWKETMLRIAPILRDSEERPTRKTLLKKRKKHMRVIRILIVFSILLLAANFALLYYIFVLS